MDVTTYPTYRLQKMALTDADAVAELGRRYAEDRTTSYQTDTHRRKVAAQYVKGWNGEQDPYFWKGGNFAAPMRRAWSAGKRDRATVVQIVEHQKGKGGE